MTAALAATIYLFNVRKWLTTDRPPAPIETLRDLERALANTSLTTGGTVSWLVRQIALTT